MKIALTISSALFLVALNSVPAFAQMAPHDPAACPDINGNYQCSDLMGIGSRATFKMAQSWGQKYFEWGAFKKAMKLDGKFHPFRSAWLKFYPDTGYQASCHSVGDPSVKAITWSIHMMEFNNVAFFRLVQTANGDVYFDHGDHPDAMADSLFLCKKLN